MGGLLSRIMITDNKKNDATINKTADWGMR
jgi:hypothetical protein